MTPLDLAAQACAALLGAAFLAFLSRRLDADPAPKRSPVHAEAPPNAPEHPRANMRHHVIFDDHGIPLLGIYVPLEDEP